MFHRFKKYPAQLLGKDGIVLVMSERQRNEPFYFNVSSVQKFDNQCRFPKILQNLF